MTLKIVVDGRSTEDITGRVFTRLKTTQFAGFIGNGLHKWPAWICECQCEKKTITPPILAANLKSEHTTSCGCILSEVTAKRNFKHGHNKRGERSKEYNSWAGFKQRTGNPNNPRRFWYSERGICHCQGFKRFETFFEAIGTCPENKESLGRINNDGHYSCGRCEECLKNNWSMNLRWEDKDEQMNNTSVSTKINGKSVSEIATQEGKTIKQVRLEHGLRER